MYFFFFYQTIHSSSTLYANYAINSIGLKIDQAYFLSDKTQTLNGIERTILSNERGKIHA